MASVCWRSWMWLWMVLWPQNGWRIKNYSGEFRIIYKSLCFNRFLTSISPYRLTRDVYLSFEGAGGVGCGCRWCFGWCQEMERGTKILQVSQKHQAEHGVKHNISPPYCCYPSPLMY
jgi:hypothetical protein